MPIPSEIQALVNRLHQELIEISIEAQEGLILVRQIMSYLPNNAQLIQFFAYFNTSLFFVENAKTRIQEIVEKLSAENVPGIIIQESGEDLATLLGETIEAKIKRKKHYYTLAKLTMKKLPDEKTLAQLVEMGKSFEDQTRKLYEMAEAFAQKYEKRLNAVKQVETTKQSSSAN